MGTLVANKDIDSILMLLNQAPIRNADKFTLEPGFVPLILRVHREEPQLFKLTLRYYAKVIDISKTMLVISFDALQPELLEEALKIDFCQVKIMLAPSGHWMQNRVPGPEPGLPDTRDQYNNPRSWTHTAVKHHFWWQTATVWEHVAELKGIDGDMCFSEADHWPLPDYYQVAKAVQAARPRLCADKPCFGSNLGGEPLPDIPTTPTDAASYTGYSLGYRGNMGMCYPRSSWLAMKRAAADFCNHDDYNWDETLRSVAIAGKIPAASVIPTVYRLVHVKHCGFHTKPEVCRDSDLTGRQARQFESEAAKWPQFDARAEWHHTGVDTVPNGQPFKGWGGWRHPVDVEFCMSLVKDK